MSNEEINSLLIHAHKRVLQLQKQIENNQVRMFILMRNLKTKRKSIFSIDPKHLNAIYFESLNKLAMR